MTQTKTLTDQDQAREVLAARSWDSVLWDIVETPDKAA